MSKRCVEGMRQRRFMTGIANYHILFLTLAACLPGMDPDEQTETRKRMRANLKRMTRLAAHCPANFLHLQLFMQAELARLDRRIEPAMRLYEHAMEVARASEFRRDEAMINELAARHLIGAGRRKAAEGYLRAAWNLHDQWGARRKVEQLEEEFSQLLSPSIARASGVSGTPDLHATTAMAVQTLLPSTESLPLHDGEQESQKL